MFKIGFADIVGGGGVAGALLTLGSGILLPWLKARDVAQKRLQVLEEATKRVSFWEAWIKAQQLAGSEPLDSIKGPAQKELYEASVTVLAATAHPAALAEAMPTAIAPEPAICTRVAEPVGAGGLASCVKQWVVRAFLLYSPPRARAWVPRVFFYSYCLAPFAGLYPFDGTETGPFWFKLLGTAVIALFFRYLSVTMERSVRATSGSPWQKF